MGILDRVRDRLARRAIPPSAERAPSRATGAPAAAWRTAAPTPSIIPTSTPAAKTAGLHRDLTVKRQHVTLQPLGHDVTSTVGGRAAGLVSVPGPVAPPRSGVVARPHGGASAHVVTPGGAVQRRAEVRTTADEPFPINTDRSDAGSAGPGSTHVATSRGALPGVPIGGGPSSAPDPAPTPSPRPIRRIARSPASGPSATASTTPPLPPQSPIPRTGPPAGGVTPSADTDQDEAGGVVHRSAEPGSAPPPITDTAGPAIPSAPLEGHPADQPHDVEPAPAPDVSSPTADVDRATAIPVQRVESAATTAPTVGLRPPLPSAGARHRTPEPTARPDQPLVDRRQASPNPVSLATPAGGSPTGMPTDPGPRPTGRPAPHATPPEDAAAVDGPDVTPTHVDVDINRSAEPSEPSDGPDRPLVDDLLGTPNPTSPHAPATDAAPTVPRVERHVTETPVSASTPDPTSPTGAAPMTSAPLVARRAAPQPAGPVPTTRPDVPATRRPGLGPALAPEERPVVAAADLADPIDSPSPTPRPIDIARQATTRTPPPRPRGRAAIPTTAPAAAESATPDAPLIISEPVDEQDGLDLLLQRMAEPAAVETGPTAPSADTSAIRIDRTETVDRAITNPDGADAGELAEQLYKRIERRLRSDLLQEVERRGHLSRWG